MTIFDRQTQVIEEYCQSRRKKAKIYSKIKNAVEEFCLRLEKITKVVSPTVLAA